MAAEVRRRTLRPARGLWLLLLVLPALACGRFEPQPTPAVPPVSATPTASPTRALTPTPTSTRPAAATSEPTATFTPTPVPGVALTIGLPARIVAPQGINLRSEPRTGARRLGRFGTGIRVTVQEGPVEADNYRWWKVIDSAGTAGWIADGDGQTTWLTPNVGEPRPVDRAIQPTDKVVVTLTGVALRAFPGTGTTLLREMPRGVQLTLVEAPVDADGLRWWHVRNDTYDGWAAERTSRERLLAPVE